MFGAGRGGRSGGVVAAILIFLGTWFFNLLMLLVPNIDLIPLGACLFLVGIAIVIARRSFGIEMRISQVGTAPACTLRWAISRRVNGWSTG